MRTTEPDEASPPSPWQAPRPTRRPESPALAEDRVSRRIAGVYVAQIVLALGFVLLGVLGVSEARWVSGFGWMAGPVNLTGLVALCALPGMPIWYAVQRRRTRPDLCVWAAGSVVLAVASLLPYYGGAMCFGLANGASL